MSDRALHLITLSRPKDALAELDKNFDSQDPSHWWIRALALFGDDRLEESLEAAASGLAIDPEFPQLLDVTARCHYHRDDLVPAEEAVLAALRLDAEDADLLTLYARIVAKAGQMDKAKKLIAHARRIDPENTEALHVEARIATAQGDDAGALSRTREILAINPEDHYAHLLAGGVLHDRGDVRGAHEHLRTAVMNNPADPIAAEIARENLLWRHPLMWPLLPVHKFGGAAVWVVGITVLLFARSTMDERVTLPIVLGWLAYVVYSWVMPRIVRRMIK